MAEIKLKVIGASGDTLAVSRAEERVSLVYTAPYADGDWIALECDEPGLYCVVQLEDTMPPALVYIKDRGMDFPIPPADNRVNYSPRSFAGTCHLLRARIATAEKVAVRRNLAFNPYDCHGNHGFYPHASANVETRGEAVFAARNAVDGIYENDAHGTWPYQSWGINRDPNAALTLDFGRPVTVDELRLTLRADFPHDSYWTQATVEFDDGSREVLHLNKTAAPQAFAIAPRTVQSLKLFELKKADDASPFPALTQIEVWGTEG